MVILSVNILLVHVQCYLYYVPIIKYIFEMLNIFMSMRSIMWRVYNSILLFDVQLITLYCDDKGLFAKLFAKGSQIFLT